MFFQVRSPLLGLLPRFTSSLLPPFLRGSEADFPGCEAPSPPSLAPLDWSGRANSDGPVPTSLHLAREIHQAKGLSGPMFV